MFFFPNIKYFLYKIYIYLFFSFLDECSIHKVLKRNQEYKEQFFRCLEISRGFKNFSLQICFEILFSLIITKLLENSLKAILKFYEI